MKNYTFDDLPPVRRARGEALLQLIDRDGADMIEYKVLVSWLVKEGRHDTRTWTAAQLEQALNDLADAGAIAIAPGRYRGTLVVERLRRDVA
jgi:hypothetical protein